MGDQIASLKFSVTTVGSLIASALLAWLAMLLICTGAVIVDGFQSLGAVSDSRYPGSLHWPMLGTFMGYQETWGFHWIGWPMLRSLLLPVLAWHPVTEMILLSLVWGAVAWQVMRLSPCKDQPYVACWIGLLTLVAPSFLVAAQSYRPEIPTALLLLLAIRFWHADTKKSALARAVVMMTLPLFHPMGFILPAAWCGWDFLCDLRRYRWYLACKRLLISSWPLLCGLILFAAWFAVKSQAWVQFQWNLKSQRALVEGMGTGWMTFFRWGFGSFSSVPLVVLLLGAAMSASLVLWRQWGKTVAPSSVAPITYASVGLLVALMFNVVAKNPNSLHVVAVLPFAVWLFVRLMQEAIGMVTKQASIFPLACTFTLLVFLAYPAKLTRQLIQNRGQSYRGALSDALASLPRSRKVLIPVALWEAAQMNKGRPDATYQFSTFPNIAVREQRELYEKQVASDMQAGDLLLWDPLQESGGIFNFVEETALRHLLLHPQDNAIWERLDDISIPFSYSRNQPAMFQVYRFRGL